MNEEKLKKIADAAKNAVDHLKEPYKSIAYKEFLNKMLSSEFPVEQKASTSAMIDEKDIENGSSLSELYDEKNPRSHPDIVMIFAYHLFGSGTTSFTVDNVLDCYKQMLVPSSKNPTDIVNTNIRKFLLSKEKKVKGEKQRYSMTRKGKEYVESFKGSVGAPREVKKNKKGAKKALKVKTPKSIEPMNFNIRGEGNVPSLKDFYNEKKPESHAEKLATYVYYINKHASIENVSEGHIVHAYKATREKRPGHIHQLILDTKNGPGYVVYNPQTKTVKISDIGEDFVELDLPRQEKK